MSAYYQHVHITATREELRGIGIDDDSDNMRLLLSGRAFAVLKRRRCRDRMALELEHPETHEPWLLVYEEMAQAVQ